MSLTLTNEELHFLKLCVQNYPIHAEAQPLHTSVREKLNMYRNKHSNYISILKHKEVIEASDVDNVQIALTTEETVPVFLFTDCPDIFTIPKEAEELTNQRFTYEFSYTNHLHSTLSLKRKCLVPRPGGYVPVSLILTEFESEVLLAFLIYHKLKSKGVCCSGLTPYSEEEKECTTSSS